MACTLSAVTANVSGRRVGRESVVAFQVALGKGPRPLDRPDLPLELEPLGHLGLVGGR